MYIILNIFYMQSKTHSLSFMEFVIFISDLDEFMRKITCSGLSVGRQS